MASEARDEMHRFMMKGRELEVVFAQERRKTPNEMRGRVVNQQNRSDDGGSSGGGGGGGRGDSFERSSSFERHKQREREERGSRDEDDNKSGEDR